MTDRPVDASFTAIDKDTTDVADMATELLEVFHEVGAISRAMTTTGTSPDHHLTYLEFGDAAAHNDVRIGYDGTFMRFEQNTGTEGTPVWTTRTILNMTSGQISSEGILMNADINLLGNDILNATEVNGVTIAGHQARHLPGGADALTTAAAVDIGSANAEGSAGSMARADHVHRGLLSFRKAGDTLLYGAVTLTGGSGITLTQVGQDVSIATVSERTHIVKTTLQNAIGAGPVAITDFTAIAFPATADGAKKFKIEAILPFNYTSSPASSHRVDVGVHVGPAGSVADPVVRLGSRTHHGTQYINDALVHVEVVPAASELVTIAITRGSSNLIEVHSGVTAGIEAQLTIERIS